MQPSPDPTVPARAQASQPSDGPDKKQGHRKPYHPEADPGPDPAPDPDIEADTLDDDLSDEDSLASDTAADDADGAEEAQPFQEDGVHEDMATAAYDRSWPGTAGLPMRTEGARAIAAPPEDGSDAAIMLRVRDGDDSGFTYLIEKYRKQIVHHMFRMTSNQAVAEELAQEVFLRVYRSRESYRAEAKFSTWLYRIATNLGVNHARDHRHERSAQSVYLDQPDAETGTTPDVADSRLTAEQGLLRAERMAGIRGAVLALPERQRQAVLMHKYQEMDYREIGAVLKLSESATKSLLFRAYQTLRERLKEYV
jgi:RNA polymerase sigma-70 factor (ECF subfamily)